MRQHRGEALILPGDGDVRKSLLQLLQEKVHIDGVTKLLSYPEFMNVAKFQSVLSLFEQRQRFAELMQKAVPGQTSVVIGNEDDELAPPDTGFVFHPITVGGKVVGAIGVIGPQRMDYKKVVASLDYFAKGLVGQIGPAEGKDQLKGASPDGNGKDSE